jgi:hypothetical protein
MMKNPLGSPVTSHSTTVSYSARERTHRLLFRSVFIGEHDDETRLIEHFNSCLQEGDNTSSTFFFGTLEQAVKAALRPDSIEDVRLALSFSAHRSSLCSSAVRS